MGWTLSMSGKSPLVHAVRSEQPPMTSLQPRLSTPLLTLAASATSGRPCVTSGQKHTGLRITSSRDSRAGCEHGLIACAPTPANHNLRDRDMLCLCGWVRLTQRPRPSIPPCPSICNGSYWPQPFLM